MVPKESNMIVEVTDSKAEVEGLGGMVRCTVAKIHTTFGILPSRV